MRNGMHLYRFPFKLWKYFSWFLLMLATRQLAGGQNRTTHLTSQIYHCFWIKPSYSGTLVQSQQRLVQVTQTICTLWLKLIWSWPWISEPLCVVLSCNSVDLHWDQWDIKGLVQEHGLFLSAVAQFWNTLHSRYSVWLLSKREHLCFFGV